MSKQMKMYRLYEYTNTGVLVRVIGNPAPYAVHASNKKILEAKNKLMEYRIQLHA